MKITAIIQARMGSSRLPNKILMPVLGIPLLGWMLKRVATCMEISNIVVATTTDPRDDAIETFVLQAGYQIFRGSEHDVLDRYYQAALSGASDAIVRLTSDCPLLDPEVLGEMVRTFVQSDVDFLSNSEPLPSTWPDGMDVSIVRFDALQRAAKNAHKPSEREHVTFYFWNNPELFRCKKIHHVPDWSKYRITLDYLEDYELFKCVMEHFGSNNPDAIVRVTVAEIISYLDNHPEVFALNARYSHGIGWEPALARDAALGFGI